MSITPIEKLSGKRIEMRLLKENDSLFAQEFFDILHKNREYFRPYDFALADPTCIKNKEELAQWIGGMIQPEHNMQENISYAIYLGNELIGMFTLEIKYFTHSAKPSFWIAPNYESKGLIQEEFKLIQKLAFEHYKLHRLGSSCYVENESSKKLHERVGFIPEGIERESIYDVGTKKYHTQQLYGQLVADWEKLNPEQV
jgi:RimJ/RimL family protein N-acetyltransferase